MSSRDALKEFPRRIATAGVLTVVCLALLFLGLGSVLIVLICWSAATEVLVMADFAARRQADARQLPEVLQPLVPLKRYAGLALLSLPAIVPVLATLLVGNSPVLILMAVMLLLTTLLLLVAYRVWPDRTPIDRLLIGWGLIALAGVMAAQALAEKPLQLLFIAIAIVVSDIAAMIGGKFGGILFPKRLVPSISPNKTYVGLIAGVTAGMTVAIALLPAYALGFAFIALLTAIASDLLFFHHKRMARVKNSGSWLSGHGGTLDRCDSLFGGVATYLVLHKLLAGF